MYAHETTPAHYRTTTAGPVAVWTDEDGLELPIASLVPSLTPGWVRVTFLYEDEPTSLVQARHVTVRSAAQAVVR
ncbi:hypothetical protein [Rhodococcus aetherivorans]|uniref:hypothetical protein n=1 Tax=Rhodococcus aetherivorans TaxID=191292 RepID=UPI00045C4DA4|nr:hypothetical protein [Rhodococcus aetherivorans]KDE12430.1 hypothetical protein N505_0115390 [Rhodococcus aetherivorans]